MNKHGKFSKKHGAPSNFFGVKVGDMKPIQKVEVSMGDTACKVPDSKTYLIKIEDKNRIGKKKKAAKC